MAVVVALVTGTLPGVALVAFALRFPETLRGKQGLLVTRIFDAILVALCVLAVVRTAQTSTLYNPWLDTAPTIFLTFALLGIVIVRLGQASGVERRRMSWVVAGSVVSAVGETFTNFEILGVLPQAPQWATTLSAGTQIALDCPLSANVT